MKMLDFSVVKVLAAVFTPGFNLTNALKIANVAVDLAGDRLDGEPTMMPIPQDAPSEIPRIVLRSSDGLLAVSISPARTTFEFKVQQDLMADIVDYQSHYSGIAEFFSNYANTLDLKTQRLAYVTERLIIGDDVISYVLDRFCNESQTQVGKPFSNAKRFEIHSHKNYEWDGFQLNSWVRLKCFPMKTEKQARRPALLVENDLNTLSYEEDPAADFDIADIGRFFSGIPDHLDQILQLYFSEE